jgi:hypothetical protein
MRKVLILFLGFFVISLSVSFAQGFMDYVKEVKGDTLVVNDYYDMNNAPNSINNVILEDTEAPAGRVYELQTLGWYPQSGGFTTPSDRPCVIVGAGDERMVQATDAPPVISGYSGEGSSSSGGITWGNDLTVKNTSVVVGAPDGYIGWAFFGSGASNRKVVFENNMMETNWWVFVQSNVNEGNSFYFKDNYFVNMSGRACRRNGGVYDNVDNNTDTMYVENNTHVMAQGYIYKFRNYGVNFIYINHNTFINCSNVVLETQGLQSNDIITNNIFVNCNVQPFRPNCVEDIPEQACDALPQGIIDVAVLPDTLEQVERKWLVQGNLAYWDSRVSDLAAEANAIPINGFTTWANQTMIMNARTQALFDDDTNYPYMSVDTWYDVLPTFTDPKDLLTTQVDVLKTFSLATVDTTSTATMPWWRLVATPVEANFVYSDFPIPVDLSYSETNLVGTDGLPVGDLNWFPADKATFMANHAEYYGALVDAWNAGTLVTTGIRELGGGKPTGFELNQNYPNPFNPTTVISFTLPKAGKVTLKVYNALGQEVATLVNGYKTAQKYNVTFDASRLAGGVYIYRLESNNFTQSKKMILMK